MTNEAAETNLDVRGSGALEWFEQKCFDGEFVAIEGGTRSGVRDRRPETGRGRIGGLCDVNAARNNLAFGWSEVESGHGLL